MQFTRLRLNGFKSFVDPTDLVIAPGLTGVVGPNGCGKSNLLEALRWVMGETRPSAMRGGGMEDVIFAGAATRNARNFAEVTLHIDNSDRLAPPALNDRDLVEVVRRITRDAGSAYKANGKEVRARDVQMLFADASTGSTSPALVRQGQISELINAKPKSRRRVLEEAAGISGLYQRRHEAELKLKSTETNLERVEDVVEQLASQLAQLNRQAKQAARYREIGEQLRAAEGLLLFRRWQDADRALMAARQALTERVTTAARAEAGARTAETARTGAEDQLPGLREEEAIAAAVLQRALVERDSLAERRKAAEAEIARLDARLADYAHEADREAGLSEDAEAMQARLLDEAEALAEAAEGHDEKLELAAEQAEAAAEALAEREEAMQGLTEAVAALAARHQAVARLVSDSRKVLERETAEAARAEAAVDEAAARADAGAEACETAAEAAEAAQEALALAEDEAQGAEELRSEAQGAEAVARGAASEAQGEAKALRAEVTGLERLVARDSGKGGQILDELAAAPGYERALGAALADDLKAPRLAGGLASGWAALEDYADPQPLPAGAAPLSAHVTGCELLARRLAQVGVVDAAEGAALQPLLMPGQRLVSREGDLWRWDGLVAAAADAPSAAALRLEQQNRLAALSADLEEAEARADEAGAGHEATREALREATSREAAAREARKRAETQLSEATRALTRAEADRNLAASKVEALGLAASRHREAAGAAEAELRRAEETQAALEDLDAARARAEAQKTVVEAARLAMLARRTAHDEIRRDGEARDKRAAQVAREQSDWQARVASAAARRGDLARRRAETEDKLAMAQDVPAALEEEAERIAEAVQEAEARKSRASDAVSAAEGALRAAAEAERAAERAASEARETRARAEAVVSSAEESLAEAEARIEEALELTPQALLEELQIDPAQLPDAEQVEATVLRLRRSRDALGAVNLRAEEDARAVQEEHDTLKREKIDLEEAISKLRSGIQSLNREGRERLLTAFEEVNANFRTLFTHLFRGGEANLVLVESDDPLEAGLEIMCQPPGKKLSTLSLLSGGEQTLTALALIFAVFLANPAPICVLDEVDAPLDDANVTRFCDMMDEMTRRTQTRFLVITHHAVTMSRMDRLFGVTMQEQGVSQLVSVDLKRAAAMVA
ncbi:chromosome segregation SMC family protein [Poseidonocella sp. HB161398]|uniref:chromosome segregation SMC family protein n=1 Tax=Poseidonocella sp. HB161398 TaxID=2320855 RepID=UPI0011091CD3|nr:AAA family ATPase [Poseidonocella sp. HB161398]